MKLTQIPEAARAMHMPHLWQVPRGKFRRTLKAFQHSRPDASNFPNAPARLHLRPDQRRSRAILASVVMALLAGVALVPLSSTSPFLGLQTCAFKGLTGLPCALCGGSRAAQAALRGDVARAYYLNMAALPGIAITGSLAILLWYEAMRGRALFDWSSFPKRLRPLLPFLLALFCCYWLVHLVDAVRGLKLDLVDLRNPIARSIYQSFSDSRR
jgi:hypothetical protein